MRLADPQFLLLILIIVPLIVFLRPRRSSLLFSRVNRTNNSDSPDPDIRRATSPRRSILQLLKIASFILIIVALARPQEGRKESEIKSDGVDIMLVLDISDSMQALDFKIDGKNVTRLDAVKNVVADFIAKRKSDRIGMVAFAEEAFTQAPLTLDHELLISLLGALDFGIAGQSTAMGDAISVGANRIRELKAKSKILILLSDGRSNAGNMDPLEATNAAATLGIKIYTIGIGSDNPAPFKVDSVFGKRIVYEKVELDEKTLKAIAEATGARYYRAEDTSRLEDIYADIDGLEKSEVSVKEYIDYNERFSLFLIPGILLLLLEQLLVRTRYLKIP